MGLMSNEILFSSPVTKPALKDINFYSLDLINTYLNEEQKRAVVGVLRAECRPKPYIIFGPPGTGKTVTIVEAILQVFHLMPESRIIVCTSANSAIDLIAEKLLESERISAEDMVRISAAYRQFKSIV